MKVLSYVFIALVLSFGTAQSKEASNKSFYIEVYYDTYIMSVWEHDSWLGLQHIGNYPVTLTWKNYRLPKKALVADVEFDPVWRPTSGVKRRYFRKHGEHLRDEYLPGEEQNAMGAFKWKLCFFEEEGFFIGDNATRVHEEQKPERIQTRDSSGCVRLLKEDGLYLTKLFWGHMNRIMVYTTSDKALELYNPADMENVTRSCY